MNLTQAVNAVYANTADVSLPAFGPELAICATIVLLLVVRLFDWSRNFLLGALGAAAVVCAAVLIVSGLGWIELPVMMMAVAGAALGFALLSLYDVWRHWDGRFPVFALALVGVLFGLVLAVRGPESRIEIFQGMLVYDAFTSFMRAFLLLFVALFLALTRLSGIPDREDGPDIYSLVLGATLGMCLMSSANHLFMVFVAVEMASVPSYVLAGLLKGRRQSSEAALKYAVYGAGTAGIMLYGISLLAGVLNTVHIPTMAVELANRYASFTTPELMVLALAGLMVMVGLAFKLSAVPFHFWCPDVFEGAAAEVNAFLSVASKAAALALLLRVAVGIGAAPGAVPVAETTAPPAAKASLTAPDGAQYVAVQDEAIAGDASSADSHAALVQKLAPVRTFMAYLIGFLAAITCTFGNLAAYGQTNIKRLLAYSTIAHAGYMMMAAPAILVLAGNHPAKAQAAAAALGLYIAVYLFMNLGAFSIVAFLRNALRSEDIADYAGLIRRAPWTVICFSLILFSLLGMPPLAGFLGKFAVFAALADGYVAVNRGGATANMLLWLLIIGGVNTAISLFYYLRVVKVMTFDPEPESRTRFTLGVFPVAYVLLLTFPLVVLIFTWNFLNEWTLHAASQLL